MPALRLNAEALSYVPSKKSSRMNPITRPRTMFRVAEDSEQEDLANCDIFYPTTPQERAAFRTKASKRVSPHQWAVYDFVRTIPSGSVTTYKDVAVALGEGSPRSVGSALRSNPFAPFVPCHRVIASNLFVGGFNGEWGQESKTGTECNMKMKMLAKEGVGFTKDGFIVGKDTVWRG